MQKIRVLIAVKTYPTISTTYDELVCTAGLKEDGTWIRLYPIKFRDLELDDKYKKYQWIEVEVRKRRQDVRPESYTPLADSIRVEEEIDTDRGTWRRRNHCFLKDSKVYTNMSVLIDEAKALKCSIATFRPSKVLDFKIVSDAREWSKEKLDALAERQKQPALFEDDAIVKRVAKKIPYKFKYKFEDENGKVSNMMIEDWELGMLYWNCLRRSATEEIAVQKVKDKYFHEFIKKDLHFFLGTTLANHFVSKNPFTIIGVYYPPFNNQPELPL